MSKRLITTVCLFIVATLIWTGMKTSPFRQRDHSMDFNAIPSMKMLFVPPGEIVVGRSGLFNISSSSGLYIQGESKAVTIDSFFLSESEVTNEQFRFVNVDWAYPSGDEHNPVDMLNIELINAYCASISNMIGRKVRLPTEYEWEYACRCGLSTVYDFGSEQSKVFGYAHFHRNYDPRREKPFPAKGKAANLWGFYDMLGNVEEVTLPCSTQARGAKLSYPDAFVILRGGSLYNLAAPTERNPAELVNPQKFVGFRVAMDRF